MRMTPKTAKTIRHNKEQTVPIESVLVGDVIISKTRRAFATGWYCNKW